MVLDMKTQTFEKLLRDAARHIYAKWLLNGKHKLFKEEYCATSLWASQTSQSAWMFAVKECNEITYCGFITTSHSFEFWKSCNLNSAQDIYLSLAELADETTIESREIERWSIDQMATSNDEMSKLENELAATKAELDGADKVIAKSKQKP